MEHESGIQVIESTGVEVFEAQERAAIDMQIATAKRYPRRDLPVIRKKVEEVILIDDSKETARACRYAKPTAGKNVTGVSVHLARMLCQQYGNLKVAQRIKQITDTTIVAEAVALDLESNYSVSVETRRTILDKNGRRYPEHLIETNAMACLAIAERNAILKILPKGLVDGCYNTAFNFANGDLDNEQKLMQARKRAIDYFAEKYEATEEDVLRVLGLRSVNQIGKEQVADLRGYMTALNDGELTAEELFGKKEKATEAPNPLAAKAKKETPKAEEPKQEPKGKQQPATKEESEANVAGMTAKGDLFE